MRYFHTLADSTIRKLIRKGITYKELTDKYKQPEWCSYPDALEGVMGCWSLMDALGQRHEISRDYCARCDCYIKEEK
jgi:hypothetical protein